MSKWTQEEERLLGVMHFGMGLSVTECANEFIGTHGYDPVRKKLRSMRQSGEWIDAPFISDGVRDMTNVQPVKVTVAGKGLAGLAAIGKSAQEPATEDTTAEYIANLEKQLATLSAQLTWAQHASSDIRKGGTITHRESDCHYADANHLLSSCEQTWQKALEVFKQYEPDKIQLVWGDDYVAGRGIYKNQDLDATVSNAEQQCQIGAVHFRKRIETLREVTDAPIHIRWLKGNHEYSNGHPLAGHLFLMVKDICDDIEGLSFKLGWDASIVNLAHDGVHNALFMHGYGFSNISPNSPRFISDVKDRLITMHRQMMPVDQIRRVGSGHTHMFSKDFERTIGLKWDTTGGWQRNARVQLGFNQRPSGSIMYVSLPGMENEILDPIGLQPDEQVYLREIEDSHLPSRNTQDSAACIQSYQTIMANKGSYEDRGSFGVLNAGRW